MAINTWFKVERFKMNIGICFSLHDFFKSQQNQYVRCFYEKCFWKCVQKWLPHLKM